MTRGKDSLLFVVTEDWYFASHRLPMARAARAAGFDVVVATRVAAHRDVILREGFRLLDLPCLRRGYPLWMECWTLWSLVRLFQRERPTLVHLVALKPAVFGSIAAALLGRPPVVCTITGLGFVFTSQNLRARLLRVPIAWVLRFFMGGPSVLLVVQNAEDRELLLAMGISHPDRCILIKGSGVDCVQLQPLPAPLGEVVFGTACRMLGDKGVRDLVEAARILRDEGRPVRVLLAGPVDLLNPSGIPEDELRRWQESGLVEWLGPIADIREFWSKAHVAVLPSHREGLPKALLEAAACSRPIVASDTSGCREVVEDGVNGLLVPIRSPRALANAMGALAQDPEKRRRMGEQGRLKMVAVFSDPIISAQMIAAYRRLVPEGRPD